MQNSIKKKTLRSSIKNYYIISKSTFVEICAVSQEFEQSINLLYKSQQRSGDTLIGLVTNEL